MVHQSARNSRPWARYPARKQQPDRRPGDLPGQSTGQASDRVGPPGHYPAADLRTRPGSGPGDLPGGAAGKIPIPIPAWWSSLPSAA